MQVQVFGILIDNIKSTKIPAGQTWQNTTFGVAIRAHQQWDKLYKGSLYFVVFFVETDKNCEISRKRKIPIKDLITLYL